MVGMTILMTIALPLLVMACGEVGFVASWVLRWLWELDVIDGDFVVWMWMFKG